MPKRKTADAKVEVPATAAARKPAAASASHKRTATKRAIQPSDVSGVTAATPAVQPATEIVASGVTEILTQPRAVVAPTHEEIASLAYSYFAARGYQQGDPAADWFRAERELLELAQDR